MNAPRSSVELVRRYAEALPDGQTGRLAGLREPYVERWRCCTATPPGVGPSMTLAARSAYRVRRWPTASFRLIGVPPMHYLASWRMQVATQKLRNTSASLAQVAEIVVIPPGAVVQST
jgi:hypothetical protein